MTTVIVVEDDPAFPTLIAAVGDMASARALIARQAPDVLLTDLGLPDERVGLIARQRAEAVYAAGKMGLL
jgi:CheY-like chemotaxis protein